MRARANRRAAWLTLLAIGVAAGVAVVLMLETVFRVTCVMPRLAVIAIVLLWAPRAWALCPNCIAQSPSSTLRLVGLFLLVPPAVFFAVAIAVRRILRHAVD